MSEQPIFQVTRGTCAVSSASYWVPKHVYVCATPEGGVIMDLRNDRYVGVTREQMRTLSSLVADWPFLAFASLQAKPSDTDASELLDTLLERGLLTRQKDQAHSTKVPGFMNATTTAAEFVSNNSTPCSVRLAHVGNFVLSMLSAAWMMRFRSLYSIVEAVSARKRRAEATGAVFDKERATQLAAIFRRLRAFSFSGREKCLFESLVLLNFLARYRLFPLWIIGVATGPFQAHSWVQYENIALVGTPQKTSFFYTPIMIV